MNIEIANRLVRLRKENHLSQEELAARHRGQPSGGVQMGAGGGFAGYG